MRKKNTIFVLILVLFALFGIVSCDQAPIFYNISLEPAPLVPYVGGTPTRMVVIGDTLYVGSVNNNKINRFSSGEWNEPIPLQTNHSLMALAGIENALAVLVMAGSSVDSLALYIYDTGDPDAEPLKINGVPGYSIQTVFGAGGEFFAGLKRDGADSYAIYRVNGSSLVVVRSAVSGGLLVGAAKWSNDYVFLATQGGGIIKCNISAAPTVEGVLAIPDGSYITGIITSGETVIAVSDNLDSGSIFVLNVSGNSFDKHAEDTSIFTFTGGMGIRVNPGSNPVLLLGVRTRRNSSDQGFRELSLNAITGRPSSTTLVNPGNTDPRLRASIGLRPVMHIMQVPHNVHGGTPSDGLIFAATSTRGLWSNRGGEWNAETQTR